ncbi:MAG: Elongation factor-1 alpha [Gammaproteobacteria bacterium]|nr:MAG: Elongation factor-1 alpha [Gammaproteobacteria bacterium]TND05015.1 MAG: Elongation factor-1 alpha [Gammaproteobacteria bacterium]
MSYPLFNQVPTSLKTLYTMILIVLGIGYVFALIQIYEVQAGRDGRPGLSVEDIRIAYSGSKADTRLEIALKGPMAGMLPGAERQRIFDWVRKDRASESAYQADIKPIVETRCKACHNGANPHIPSLISYDELSKMVVLDTGVSVGTLVRVSHIHLFGITFIFGFMGLVFCHAHMRSHVLKNVIIAMPFVAIILDIASWWLTKVSTPFAYVVVVGGGLMGISFAVQWTVSMYQMWLAKTPPPREGS